MVPNCFAVAVAALLAGGCKTEAQRNLAAEVDRLALAINQLRDAPNNRKDGPLESLKAVACDAPAACELKQICVQGYALHTKSISATSKVRQALRGEQGASEGAAALLQVSEQNLQRAQELIARCTSLQGELQRETR